jgi:hypothetical protein
MMVACLMVDSVELCGCMVLLKRRRFGVGEDYIMGKGRSEAEYSGNST